MIELLNNPYFLVPDSFSHICILKTDVIESEILIRKLAADTENRYPTEFSGESPQVFFRMRYTPPYDHFQEIRKLILQIRQATGIRSCFRGIVAIDVSEYKGHEEEEYFTIFLKYLFDNVHGSKIVFVCPQYTDKEIQNLFQACMIYFPTLCEQINVYEQRYLRTLLVTTFSNHNINVDSDSIDLMTAMLCSKELYNYRSLQLIDRLPEELRLSLDKSSREPISNCIPAKTVKDYFKNPHSPICRMAGHPLITGKELSEYAI